MPHGPAGANWRAGGQGGESCDLRTATTNEVVGDDDVMAKTRRSSLGLQISAKLTGRWRRDDRWLSRS